MPLATPPVGWVRLSSTDPPLSLTCRLGQDRPDVSSGYGGWDEVVRPLRPPITTYKAPPGLHLTLSLMLDAFASGASVERDIAQLDKMATATASDGATPRVQVWTTGSAVPYTDRVWIVGELAWGDAEMNERGNRTRQQVTLTLYEYVEDVYLTEKSAAKRRQVKTKTPKKKPGAPAKRIKAKTKRKTAAKPATRTLAVSTFATSTSAAEAGDGEDLLAIAARELGDANRWVEIAQLNGIRDPRSIAPGQVIRLP